MPFPHARPRARSLLAIVALMLAGVALAGATSSAGADHDADKQQVKERLVVRGDATVVDGDCPGGVCALELADGSFRGTVGTGAYTGSLKLRVAELFPNGEGGVCAPIDGHIVLGEGTPDRLVLSVAGDSCQDGAGPLTASSFTGLARFSVKYGTGAYARARGSGLAVFAEDAADHDRMTLVGHISR
jgi:hypothetical protein